jgi:hypothetical protein
MPLTLDTDILGITERQSKYVTQVYLTRWGLKDPQTLETSENCFIDKNLKINLPSNYYIASTVLELNMW